MAARVVVVGGGYGGIAVAQALDDDAEVVLIEPREVFVHHVAALRGLVDAEWAERIFFPYDGLLDQGRVVRDRAARAEAGAVTLASGARLDADYVVLATGSTYPFPAKMDVLDAAGAVGKIRSTHAALADAERVLLLGAGPVGLELAGEIKAAWPEKSVTIVDPANDILGGGYVEEFRAELRQQLQDIGVELRLGTQISAPPVEAGAARTFGVSTSDGSRIGADIWFRCYGATPVSDYLAPDLATARSASGHLDVTPELRLVGQDAVFAIGDVTAIPETKLAKAAGVHADVVAANVRSLLAGQPARMTYSPASPGIALPLGPAGGATYTVETGVLGAETTAQIKGAHLRVGYYAEMFSTSSSSSRMGMS